MALDPGLDCEQQWIGASGNARDKDVCHQAWKGIGTT
jgi:hypothetical protein